MSVCPRGAILGGKLPVIAANRAHFAAGERSDGSPEALQIRVIRARRAPDPLEPVIGKLIEEWPEIKAPRVAEVLRDEYGYVGSVDLVRKRMRG